MSIPEQNEITEFHAMGYEIDKSGVVFGKSGGKLKTHKGTSGYVQVNCHQGSKCKTFLVHRLVAMKYIPNPENKPQVNHKDGDKANNQINNLEWATRSENMKHGFNTGLITKSMISRTGNKHWKSKPVRRFNILGEPCGIFEGTREAARITGFNATSIQDACRGKLNTYKGYTWKYI